jgi:hypothetical protein
MQICVKILEFKFLHFKIIFTSLLHCRITVTLTELNKHQTNLKFVIEKEQHNSINFLDLTIHRKKTKLEFAIYRQHTQTNIIIPNDSCHPYECKLPSTNAHTQ